MIPSALFFLLRIVLAIWALFWFHMKFKVVFSNSLKNVSGSLMGIALNLKLLWVVWPFLQYLFFLSMKMECFSFVRILFYFLEQWFTVLLEEVLHVPCKLYS